MDLLTYLRLFEPENLVRLHGRVYCTHEHDSLKISNGKWMWWSRGFGGVSALDYLVKVKGLSFANAMEVLCGKKDCVPSFFNAVKAKEIPKKLLLPELRKELKLIEDIEKRSPVMEKQLEQIEKERIKEVQR